MCGISGYMNLKDGVDAGILRKMNHQIIHRGPDDEGYTLFGSGSILSCKGKDTVKSFEQPMIDEIDGRQFFLGFGFRRLSILELSELGHQPMISQDGSICIVFNGEIYNYVEIRKELLSKGYRFKTDSDTEVIISSYQAWGEECVKYFNGMWGLAIWDSAKRKIFCSRDRLGAKPFYYFLENDRFYFGSEIKQICECDECFQFDKEFVSTNFLYGIMDYNNHTIVESIKSLEPGRNLVITLSDDFSQIISTRMEKYWDLEIEQDNSLKFEECMQAIYEEISRGIRWRLRSDVPIAALLSGGLDSSCLVSEICNQLAKEKVLSTYTTSYPSDTEVEEWNYAEMVNRFCRCSGNRILPDPTLNIEQKFENLVWHIETPASVTLLGPREVIKRAHEDGYKVILNGQCGDESWLGYERYYSFFFREMLKHGKLRSTLREFKLANLNSRLSLKELALYYTYFNFPAIRDRRVWNRSAKFCSRELLNSMNKEENKIVLYPEGISNLQYNELRKTQLPHIVHFDDRLYMSESVESRIPFMDYQLVELAMRIPSKYKIHDGYTKYIIRRIFENKLPKEVIWRKDKMGFGAPSDKWKRAFSKEYMYSFFDHSRTGSLFNIGELRKEYSNNKVSDQVFYFIQMEILSKQLNINE